MHEDRILTCCECGGEFVFTRSQQQFHETLGFRSTPRRCKPCRRRRGGTAGAGRARRSERLTWPARCSACGLETTVPFEPDPQRAAFCPACYLRRRALVR
jgi:CxxC-x17-CxxC domain-containing protein